MANFLEIDQLSKGYLIYSIGFQEYSMEDALHYSVDFIFLSFGIMGFIVEL